MKLVSFQIEIVRRDVQICDRQALKKLFKMKTNSPMPHLMGCL